MIFHMRRFLLFCFVLVFATFSLAQSSAPIAVRNPKLGLVLEGGGALGLAHIGVIRWLEEHHVPVSYIAGTSMGGLVGGVYATGRNAAEVKDVVKEIDWDAVIRGTTPYDDLSYRRKEDAREFAGTAEFGMHHGMQAPSGFNSGQHVTLILDRVSLQYSQIKSFDDLPIPFACVGTDLSTNSEHVFRSGELDIALRSTMSLPGIFMPVRSGSHIYVDGGLLNNLPVDVAKEMGADITLAVHLEVRPLEPDASLSSLAVLAQSMSVVIAVNERKSIDKADLVISVPLQRFDSMDYKKVDSIIEAGYDAASTNAEKLSKLSVDEVTWNTYLAQRDARKRNASTVPQFIEVTGVSKDSADDIAKEMSDLVGKPVDSAKVDADIMRVTGGGSLSSIDYDMIERDGKVGLRVEALPKSYSPPIVRPVISIDGSDYNDVFFSMGARITFLDFGGYRRELRTDVMIGSQYQIATEYYRPFSATSRWFIAPRGGFNNVQYPIYDQNTFLAVYRNHVVGGGLDLGYTFGRTSELRAGYEGGYEKLNPEIGNSSALPTISGATGDTRVQFHLTTLDDPVIPRKGEWLLLYTKYFNVNPSAPEAFPMAEVNNENFFQLSSRNSIFLNAFGGSTFGYDAGIPAFQLGGVTRFAAYGTNELLTNQYYMGQTGYIRTLKKLPPLLGSSINLLAGLEAGKTFQLPHGPRPPNIPGDVVGAIILNTRFGPVELGGAVGNYGRAKIFFQIGRVF
jgi:NTE family protein